MDWLIPVVASAASIIAAFIAGRYASRAKSAELEAARIRDLENRLAASKAEIYEPVVELVRNVFDSAKTGQVAPAQTFFKTLTKFGTWVQIYGSDESVRAFHRMMQTAFTAPPSEVMMRFSPSSSSRSGAT